MKEKIMKAHLQRAKEKYDGPDEGFQEYFKNEYVPQYVEEEKGQKKGVSNTQAIDKYAAMLAAARDNQEIPEQPGLLQAIQKPQKGPYPANSEEDDHLLEQLMKFIYLPKVRDSIFKMLKSAKKNLGQLIAQTAATAAAKIIFEARKHREVTEPTEEAILRICVEELWTITKNLGLKTIPKQIVESNYMVAQGMFDKMEMKGGQSGR